MLSVDAQGPLTTHAKQPSMPSVYLQTFGCQMNTADSNGLAHQAWSMGCTFTQQPDEADIIIVNTCAIREKAETRVYGRLGALKPIKDRHPDMKLLVAGCLAEKDREIMRRKAPHVDALLGPREYKQFKALLASWGVPTDAPPPETDFIMPSAEDDPSHDGAAEFAHVRALVNITRGCEKFCTYCIVPYTRGPLESIDPDEIEAQVRREIQRRSCLIQQAALFCFQSLAAGSLDRLLVRSRAPRYGSSS